MKKILRRKMVWNNVRFIPDRSDIWYRFYDHGQCLSSVISKGVKVIEISRFTSDNDVCGWTVSLWESGKVVASKELISNDKISSKRVGWGEDEALSWTIGYNEGIYDYSKINIR